MNKFATVYKAAMRKVAEPALFDYLYQVNSNVKKQGINPEHVPSNPEVKALYNALYSAYDDDGLHRLYQNNSPAELTVRGQRGGSGIMDSEGHRLYYNVIPAGWLYNHDWNSEHVLKLLDERNARWNPYSIFDPRYHVADKYIKDRANENRERFRNGTLDKNEPTNVPLPAELSDPAGERLQWLGTGFANTGANRAAGTV